MKPLHAPFLFSCLALAGALLCMPLPAVAQEAAVDAGAEIESRFGVVGRNTAEGRELNDRLARVVEKVVRAVNADRGAEGFQLRSAQILGGKSEKHDKVVNALALPDGRIYVTLGLMRLLQDSPRREDELAFVVGHEVIHVIEKHSELKTRGTLSGGVVTLLLAALSKTNTSDVSAMGAAAYGSHFSRRNEHCADEGGLRAMSRAGYEPQAAAMLLQRLRTKGERENRLFSGWFGTHPLTEKRISHATHVASELQEQRKVAKSQ